MNLLQRLSSENRVKLYNYYAERYPNTYAAIIEELEKYEFFLDLPFGIAKDVCSGLRYDINYFCALFEGEYKIK